MALPASYCNVQDIFEVVPSIGSHSSITSAYIAAEIGRTQAMIDGRLAARYSVPFSPVPHLIEAIAVDLSAKAIIEKRIFSTNRTADDKMLTGFEHAMKLLSAVASGTVSLVDSAGSIVAGRADVAQIWSSTDDYAPTMHSGEWADMVQDPDRLDDIADERA